MRCVPRLITLAEARTHLPFLSRAVEQHVPMAHFQWAPLNDMPCWAWQGWLDEKQYGRIRWGEQRSARVHRVVFETLRGSLDPAAILDHGCRNHPCCNPWHLQPVTIAVNTARGARAEGICRNGLHEMTGDNVIERWRDGLPRYECRACKAARQ